MTSKSDRSGPRPEADAVPVAGATDVDESLLRLDDVALLAGAIRSGQLPMPTIKRLVAANRTDPRFSRHYQVLTALARQAGFDPVRDQDLETALDCHRDFQRLLDAEAWEQPSEVLDPGGEIGIYYRELVHIAEAHAERAPDESKAQAVREKLHKAWAAQREKVAPVTHFVARLLEHDDETAEALLQQAASEHRRQRKVTP